MFGAKQVLVADIGGTNCTLAIVNKDFKIIAKKKYSSQQISNFSDVIKDFFKENKNGSTDACFGVAGPISEDKKSVQGTNIPWAINTDVLIKETQLKKIKLINDFEAVGYGVNILDNKNPDKIQILNQGKVKKGPIAIIGAGTGLGIGYLVELNGKFFPMPSEGGHSSMALENNDDYNFREYLKKELKISNPDLEDSLSGRGIGYIFDFLVKNSKQKINPTILNQINSVGDRNAAIAINASKDKMCLLAMQLFIKYYARATRNLAMIFLPSKIFIAGGIASKNIGMLFDKNFLGEYINHKNDQAREILSDTPIHVVMDYEVSLYGCANAVLNY